MNVDNKVFKCSVCRGTGNIDVSSHDCWGKSEWYTRSCSACGGYGFVLDPILLKYIKSIVEVK